MSNKQKVHEPLFHISKRASMPWYYSWLIRLVSILAALIVSGAVTMLLTHQNRNSVGKRHNLVELMCNYNN